MPTEQEQLEAVKQNGWAIESIENPSEAVQRAAGIIPNQPLKTEKD
jgi:hypothetical protein